MEESDKCKTMLRFSSPFSYNVACEMCTAFYNSNLQPVKGKRECMRGQLSEVFSEFEA